jgi:hypothetical protein
VKFVKTFSPIASILSGCPAPRPIPPPRSCLLLPSTACTPRVRSNDRPPPPSKDYGLASTPRLSPRAWTNPTHTSFLRSPHPSCQEGHAQEGCAQEEGCGQEEVSAQLLHIKQPSRGNRRWIRTSPVKIFTTIFSNDSILKRCFVHPGFSSHSFARLSPCHHHHLTPQRLLSLFGRGSCFHFSVSYLPLIHPSPVQR